MHEEMREILCSRPLTDKGYLSVIERGKAFIFMPADKLSQLVGGDASLQ